MFTFKTFKALILFVAIPVILLGCVVQSEQNHAVLRIQDSQLEHMRVWNDMQVERLENRILKLQFMLDTVESELISTKADQEWSMDWILSDIEKVLSDIDTGETVKPKDIPMS